MKYVSKKKPEGCLIKECANGNNDAFVCASTIYLYIDWIDNVIDGDVKTNAEETAKVSLNLFMVLSFNPFFLEHKEKLAPVLLAAFNAWLDSESLKDHEDYRVRVAGDVLKGYFLEVFYLIGFITGGYDLMRKLSAKWRGFDFDARPQEKEPSKETGNALVTGPREWDFTKDHFPHPKYLIEWWYGAGLLCDGSKEYGYHFAQFRIKHEYHIHFSLFEIESGKLLQFEAAQNHSNFDFHSPNRFAFSKDFDNCSVSIDMKQSAPAILQGYKGYSVKSARPNHASHYYSIPELRTTLTLKTGDEPVVLEGKTWFDHEFGSSLKPDGFGWIFFFAWMDDGTTLNGYFMKEESKINMAYSQFTRIHNDGTVVTVTGESAFEGNGNLFTIHSDKKIFHINLQNPNNPMIRSSLGNYLELPCKVEVDGLKGTGYIEITT